jgi:glycosyltransferase involved in cell wall biosynthesis
MILNPENVSLSVVLPMHNEEENAEATIRQCADHLPTVSDDYEILAVNDGSKDGTAKVLARLVKEIPSLRVITHPVNQGYGAAVRTGLKEAAKDLVVFMDSDGQFDFREVNRLLLFIDEYDMVSGCRIERKDPMIRDLMGTAFNALVRFLYGVQIADINCGFKLYRKKVLEQLDLKTPGAVVNAETLALAKRKGFTLMFVGVTHYPRQKGEQSGANLKVVFRAVWEIIQLYRRLRKAD